MTGAVRSRIPVPLLVLFGALSAMGPLATDMYLAALPRITEDLHTRASTVQLTLSACMVGLAAGQLVVGPLSDQFGRRRPLLVGSVVCVLAALGCALAPTIGLLILCRFLLGFSGSAGVVVARSMITDLTESAQTARYMNLMMMVNGLAPIIAPALGGGLLAVSTWRWVFVALTAVTALMAVGAVLLAPESLPVQERHSGGLRAMGRGFLVMLRRPRYMGFTLAFIGTFGMLFSYISGSAYVLQNILGLGPTQFSLAFGLNSLGILLASSLSAWLLRWMRPESIARGGLVMVVAASLLYLWNAVTGPQLAPTMVLLFLCASGMGLVGGNTTSLALEDGRDRAGTASALLGAAQFAMGALVSPLVSLGGPDTAVPMAVMMLVCSVLALAALLVTLATTTPVQRLRRGE